MSAPSGLRAPHKLALFSRREFLANDRRSIPKLPSHKVTSKLTELLVHYVDQSSQPLAHKGACGAFRQVNIHSSCLSYPELFVPPNTRLSAYKASAHHPSLCLPSQLQSRRTIRRSMNTRIIFGAQRMMIQRHAGRISSPGSWLATLSARIGSLSCFRQIPGC